jgi:hypothetical protein
VVKVRAQVQTHMHATWSALFRNDFVAAEEADAKVKALCPEVGGLPGCFRDRTLTGVEGDARSFLNWRSEDPEPAHGAVFAAAGRPLRRRVLGW